MLQDEDSSLYKLMTLPELVYNSKFGYVDKLTLSCLALLWCADHDVSDANKELFFKELSRENSIKYLIERLIRLSTLLVYGRLKDFNINSNQFFYD